MARSRLWSGAGMAAVMALVAVVAGCGSSPGTSPGAGVTAPTPLACPAFGSTADASGGPAVTRTPPVALLRNVQVQASACADEVSFLFLGGVPGWAVGYRDGPLVEDPSGLPAPVAGAAHLVARFEPASGVDVAHDPPLVVYDGPTTLTPAAPSGVAQVRRLGEFEAVASWAIGVPDRRPFEVVVRQDQVVVRLQPSSPRTTRCTLPGAGVTVGYPAGWYAELSDRWACRFFDPSPFAVQPASDSVPSAVTVQHADAAAGDVVARTTGAGARVQSHPAVVAGLPATVLDVTATGRAMLPAGFVFRMYVVATEPLALLISGAPAPPGPQAERNRAAVDRIAGLVRIDQPSR